MKAIGGENDDSSKAIIIAIISYNFSYNLAIIDWKNSLTFFSIYYFIENFRDDFSVDQL